MNRPRVSISIWVHPEELAAIRQLQTRTKAPSVAMLVRDGLVTIAEEIGFDLPFESRRPRGGRPKGATHSPVAREKMRLAALRRWGRVRAAKETKAA